VLKIPLRDSMQEGGQREREMGADTAVTSSWSKEKEGRSERQKTDKAGKGGPGGL